MPEHYFTENPETPHDEQTVEFNYRGNALRFTTDAGTFSRDRVDPGSALLLSTLGEVSGNCVDIGCGWGAMGLSLAKANSQSDWLLIDINERSAQLARRNALQNQIANARVIVGDGLSEMAQSSALVITNPPIRAGNAVVRRFFDEAYAHLETGGLFYTVLRKKQGAPSAKIYLKELFGNCETVARSEGYHILVSKRG